MSIRQKIFLIGLIGVMISFLALGNSNISAGAKERISISSNCMDGLSPAEALEIYQLLVFSQTRTIGTPRTSSEADNVVKQILENQKFRDKVATAQLLNNPTVMSGLLCVVGVVCAPTAEVAVPQYCVPFLAQVSWLAWENMIDIMELRGDISQKRSSELRKLGSIAKAVLSGIDISIGYVILKRKTVLALLDSSKIENLKSMETFQEFVQIKISLDEFFSSSPNSPKPIRHSKSYEIIMRDLVSLGVIHERYTTFMDIDVTPEERCIEREGLYKEELTPVEKFTPPERIFGTKKQQYPIFGIGPSPVKNRSKR